MAGEADIENAALAKLARIGGGSFVHRMIDGFLGYAPRMIAEARAGQLAGNLEPVERAGHSLKSSATNLGLPAMQAVCLQLERAAHERRTEAIPELIDELERAFIQAQASLEGQREGFPK